MGSRLKYRITKSESTTRTPTREATFGVSSSAGMLQQRLRSLKAEWVAITDHCHRPAFLEVFLKFPLSAFSYSSPWASKLQSLLSGPRSLRFSFGEIRSVVVIAVQVLGYHLFVICICCGIACKIEPSVIAKKVVQ
jgi:hypothetical protein